MLSDFQIERYARQIVLPEIGGRGQERLLGARAAIRGSGDAALVAASYLAGAGVGKIDLEPATDTPIARALGFRHVDVGDPLTLALSPAARGRGDLSTAISARNPDCRIARGDETPEVVVYAGGPIPERFESDVPVLWGAAVVGAIVRVQFPRGTACAPCVAASLTPREQRDASPVVLGSVLAIDALRILTAVAEETRPTLIRLPTSSGEPVTIPFRGRDDCPRCRARHQVAQENR